MLACQPACLEHDFVFNLIVFTLHYHPQTQRLTNSEHLYVLIYLEKTKYI